MKRDVRSAKGAAQGPSQRQLRAGELVRHALSDVFRAADLHDELLAGVSVTITEVRMSPDLKHAICFVEPLGGGVVLAETAAGGAKAAEVVKALNRHAKFLRGQLGRLIDMKFTPDLRFIHDESFAEAQRIEALFNRPEVRRDLEHGDD